MHLWVSHCNTFPSEYFMPARADNPTISSIPALGLIGLNLTGRATILLLCITLHQKGMSYESPFESLCHFVAGHQNHGRSPSGAAFCNTRDTPNSCSTYLTSQLAAQTLHCCRCLQRGLVAAPAQLLCYDVYVQRTGKVCQP